MSKAFRLIIVLTLVTYNFSFAFCQLYGEPKITHRPRKSGTRTRSFKINLPQKKTFQIRDRKAFGIADIYSEKFLKEIESHMQNPEFFGAQQWPAAVETQPRKKEKFLEPDQKSRQDKMIDMLQSEELNDSVEATKTQKNPQKEIHQLKEKIRKEKQNKKDWKKKKEESFSNESSEQIMSKELKSEQIMSKELKSEQIMSKESKSEQIKNDHLPKSSQTAVVEKSNLRGGVHHYSGLLSRHRDHQNDKHNNHCVKKCFIPRCKVECTGRQGSAACSANKCKASTRGPDSAAVCKGDKCLGECSKAECIAACEGNYCSVKCKGNICHAVAEGQHAESVCEGEFCVSFSKGNGSKPKCGGRECQTWCVGSNCFAKCHGSRCEAMCSGKNCKAECVGKNCTKFHYTGTLPVPDKPWILDSDSSDTKSLSSKSQDMSVSTSNENGYKSIFAAQQNQDKNVNDGYYGNKVHIKNTLIDKVSNNNGYFVNTGNNVNTYTYDKKDNVTIDYDVVVAIGKQFGEFIKQKVAQFHDMSLLDLLPSLL